ncbi:MAG: PLDc N-terminal domain-containing protein [Ilumatobacteraceae bacterium]
MTLWEWFGIAVLAVVLGSYLLMLVAIFADIFRDHDLGGVGKAAWVVGLILFPVLGALVYLVARGDGMSRRQAARHTVGPT